MQQRVSGNLVWMGGPTRIYYLNDNHGECFTFRPSRTPGYGMLDQTHAPNEWLDSTAQPRRVALAAAMATDVLLAHAQAAASNGWSHRLPAGTKAAALVATARRAAWTSLAFAFRAAAASKLDIDVQELEAGIRFLRDPTSNLLYPEIFLSDAIENGAGYVSFLAQEAEFADLLDRVEKMIRAWDGGHACDTSCYACLRDWTNNPYHPLLDWRLAGDVLDILRYGAPSRDRWAQTRRLAVQAAVEAFDWSCPDLDADVPRLENTHGRPVEVVHPLADRDRGLADPEGAVVIADVFNLNRRPGAIYLIV
jgi:hypothetical protein